MNIVLLTGGLSSEREVSLTSGKSIAAGLREAGHNVRVVDPIYGDKEVSEEKIFENTVKRDYPTAEALNELKELPTEILLRALIQSSLIIRT